MADKPYTIDDIIREIKENKIDEAELEQYAEDYQKYDTTALLDDVLGREPDDLLAGIPVSDSALTEEENQLLEEILKEEPAKAAEPKAQEKEQPRRRKKPGQPRLKPLRPVSDQPKQAGFSPLQRTPATAQSKEFTVHKDHVTGLISKVDIREEAERQKREAERTTAAKEPFAVESGFRPKRPRPFLNRPEKDSAAPEEKAEPAATKAEEAASAQSVPARQAARPAPRRAAAAPAENQTAKEKPAPVPQPEQKSVAEQKPTAEKQPQPVSHPEQEKPELKRETVSSDQQLEHVTFVAHTAELEEEAAPSLSVEEPTIEATAFGVEEPTLEADPAEFSRRAGHGAAPEQKGDGTFSSTTTAVQGSPLHTAGIKQKVDINDTSKLKYIALRKSRQSRVRDFSLEPDYNKNDPLQPERKIEEDMSINVSPPPIQLPLIEDLTDELERGEQEEGPLFRAEKKKGTDAPKESRWEELKPLAGEEEEYTSYAQTDEVYDLLHELRHGAIFRCAAAVVIFVLSLAMVLLSRLPGGNPVQLLDPQQNPMVFCAVNLVLAVLLCLFSLDTLRDGIAALARRSPNKASCGSAALIASLLCPAALLADPEMVNAPGVFVYVPVMAICMAGWYLGRTLDFARMVRNFHFVSGKTDKYAAELMESQRLAEDFTRGALNNRAPHFVMNRKTPFLSSFLQESFTRDVADQQARYLLPAAGAFALIAAVAAFFLGGDLFNALTVFSGTLIVGAGASASLAAAVPFALAQKDLSRQGGAVLGYRAVVDYSEVNSMLISANDLFRTNDVTLYGIKTFSNMAIDRAILDATSVLCETKSILGGIFLNIISDRKDYLDPVDTLIYEDGMGISAWIKDRRVLIGSRELMINHNIDVPSRDYESRYLAQNRNLIYLSAAGELSAVFVIGVTGNDTSRNMLVDLYNHDITAIIKTVDPILTREQLAAIFEMPEDAFRVIPSRLHKEEEQLADCKEPLSGAVSNNGTFPAYLYSVLTAKLLYRRINLMQLLNCISIGAGVLLFVVFTALKSVSQLSPLTLCLYEGFWAALLCVIAKVKKLIS